MPLFKHVGDLVAEEVRWLHGDGGGESCGPVEPGGVVDAVSNPDPSVFVADSPGGPSVPESVAVAAAAAVAVPAAADSEPAAG